MDVPNGKTRALLVGVERVRITKYMEQEYFYEAEIERVELSHIEDEESYKNILIKALNKYIHKAPYVGNAILNQVDIVSTLYELTDLVISFLPFSYEKKKRYVMELDPSVRVRMLIEDMNKKLLTIKILERSKSLRRKVFVWFSQISKGISEILKYACAGIKEYQKIEKREKYKQLQLKL